MIRNLIRFVFIHGEIKLTYLTSKSQRKIKIKVNNKERSENGSKASLQRQNINNEKMMISNKKHVGKLLEVTDLSHLSTECHQK